MFVRSTSNEAQSLGFLSLTSLLRSSKDLIEDYFRVKKRLEEVLKHIKYSKSSKAHLCFGSRERRELRNELLRGWRFSKHYVDSAINFVIGLVKGWIRLYNRGKAKSKPKITRKTVYIKNTLFSYKNGILKISIEPNKRYLEVDLRNYAGRMSNFTYLLYLR